MGKNWLNFTALFLGVWTGLCVFYKFIIGLLDLFGLYTFAKEHKNVIDIINIPEVNWTGVYFLLFVFSATFLVSSNFDAIKKWNKKRKKSKETIWNMSFEEAMRYLRHDSDIGKPWSEKQDVYLSAECLKEAANQGKISIAAMPVGKFYNEQFILETNTIKVSYKETYGDIKFVKAGVYDSQDKNVGNFIFFDENQIRKLWKSRHVTR